MRKNFNRETKHEFLHEHTHQQVMLGVDPTHVIVDRKDWYIARYLWDKSQGKIVRPYEITWRHRLYNWVFNPKGTWYGKRCSGWRVFPDSTPCGGCSDCKSKRK